MRYFSVTYTDSLKFDRKPNEDFYLISKKYPIFVIADGVTQSHFQSGKYSGEYAFPAGAKTAAQIFCYRVLEFLGEKLVQKSDKEEKSLIEKAFDFTNQGIRELNINEGIDKKLDFIEHDWFDTVGVVGFILKNKIFYGFVGDCGLVTFDKGNKLKFQTKDMVKPVIRRAKKIYKDWDSLSKEKSRFIMRKDFRNRRDGKGYGSFTGEEGVKKYYQIGSQNLKLRDLIVFYSDGFINYLKFPEFIKILRKKNKIALGEFSLEKARKDYYRFGTDRTLIAVNY